MVNKLNIKLITVLIFAEVIEPLLSRVLLVLLSFYYWWNNSFFFRIVSMIDAF